MTMTDPIADMLTRIRNAVQARHDNVIIPGSKIKAEIARILKEEGYVKNYAVETEGVRSRIKIELKYTGKNKSAITEIKRVSKPGLRIYVAKDEIPKVLNGLGVAIVSTSRGLLTDRSARELGVGGELLCSVH